jgi:SAM-dependent methyltransferase
MSVLSYVYTQFGRPRGVLGYVAGYVMAHRPSNVERNDWALSLLSIKPTDRVLEIGFGPGIAAAKSAARAAEVVGVDRSPLMLRQATRRNKELIQRGKLRLMLGSVEALAPELGLFDERSSILEGAGGGFPRAAESAQPGRGASHRIHAATCRSKGRGRRPEKPANRGLAA